MVPSTGGSFRRTGSSNATVGLVEYDGSGPCREEWEPEIEAARQNYRLLAERAKLRGDAKLAKQCCEDLESAVKLARMDLQELQGIPLPNQ